MAVITMLSSGGSPGVTTTVAALATMWPDSVLMVDADPLGGDLIPGWLGHWWVKGWIRSDRGVASFLHSTRQLNSVPAEGFVGHVQEVPGSHHARILGGVGPSRRSSTTNSEWLRIASAARDLSQEGVDVLIDAGRFGPDTPWPLLRDADLTVLALRPTVRYLRPAMPLVPELLSTARRLEVIVCATTPPRAIQVSSTMGLPLTLASPDDPRGAREFSDGVPRDDNASPSPLRRAAREIARGLYSRFRFPESRRHQSLPNGEGAA